MLYIIGLGLNVNGISKQGIEKLSKCKKVYLENYTVEFPYSLGELKQAIDKKIIPLGREDVESFKIIDEAKKCDVALLVYGSPLSATTHISLVNEAKASEVKCKIIYSASIFDAVAETGLQLYKFGKTASMPKWDLKKNFIPDSFVEIIKDNQKINAHTLLLIDIGLKFEDAIKQLKDSLEKHKTKIDKIVVCERLGAKGKKIAYGKLQDFEDRKFYAPFCIIIPSKLHFLEKEILEQYE